ncbi:hypothetical protein AB0N38_14350 [Micromonospora aurantiaca]|uniref:hypothetical protein n=1 Tax=Micromonospora aurantiaca (nom. illeg.) TaxID=47850 RepID=UPI003436EE95
METAVILIPADVVDNDRALARCMEHLIEARYHLDSIVHSWDAAVPLLASGRVQVVIVDTEGHLPVGHSPRVEVAAHGGRRTPGSRVPSHRRRPRVIR